jgi:hypothetical protein
VRKESGMSEQAKRRALLKGAGLAGLAAVGGCRLLKPSPPVVYCPAGSAMSAPDGRLTIDVHTHVFNGTDLPVEPFFRLVLAREFALPGAVARMVGLLLQGVSWQVAPGADAEIARLAPLMPDIARCEGKAAVRLEAAVQALANDAHRRGVEQLKNALLSPAASLLRDKGAARLDSVVAIDVLAATAVAEEIERLDPEESYADYRRRLRAEDEEQGLVLLARRTARGMIAFVLQNFQYRYVTIHDYLRLYNRPGKRVVDLMMPMMVDYDWWLARGKPTLSSLEKQVDVMEMLAVATGGRVHAFVPFDPLREVMHGLDAKHPGSLDLVKRALDRGCIGVKLYPPMGFAPFGNEEIHSGSPGFWRRDWLPDAIKVPDLGRRLDDALRRLYEHCVEHDVPVMAHTGLSNGPSDDFQALAGAQHWKKALCEYRDLRINFGHFGDTEPIAHGNAGYARAFGFTDLMQASGAGVHAYADSGFFTEAVDDGDRMRSVLERLYTETQAKGGAALANRFLYGTDWEMTITHGRIDNYLGAFEDLFAQLADSAAPAGLSREDLARKFFGANAVAYAGLRASDRTRRRLQAFYDRHRVPTPDWMRKVDRLGA